MARRPAVSMVALLLAAVALSAHVKVAQHAHTGKINGLLEAHSVDQLRAKLQNQLSSRQNATLEHVALANALGASSGGRQEGRKERPLLSSHLQGGNTKRGGPEVSRWQMDEPPALAKELLMAGTVDQVLAVVKARDLQFSDVDISTALTQLAELGVDTQAAGGAQVKAVLDPLLSRVARSPDYVRTSQMSKIVSGLASIKYPHMAVFNSVAHAVVVREAAVHSHGLASLAWAFSVLDIPAPAMHAAIVKQAVTQLENFSPGALVDLLWGSVRSNSIDDPQYSQLLSDLLVAADPFLAKCFDLLWPSYVARAAWAYGAMRLVPPEFFHWLVGRVSERVGSYSIQDLSLILWASSSMQVAPAPLLKVIAEETVRRNATNYSPIDIAGLVAGFHTLGAPAGTEAALLATLKRKAQDVLPRAKPHELATITWGFMQGSSVIGEIITPVELTAKRNMDQFHAIDLVILVRAFTQSRHKSPELFKAIQARAETIAEQFTVYQLSTLVWCLTTLESASPRMAGVLKYEVQRRQDELSADDLSHFIWSFVMVGRADIADFFSGVLVKNYPEVDEMKFMGTRVAPEQPDTNPL